MATKQKANTAAQVGYNKVCDLKDFAALEADFRAFGVSQDAHRKNWEILQALRALRDFGALRPEARVLGLGAGKEPTIFILTNFVETVHATDLYAGAGMWSADAPPQMLVAPEQCAPPGLQWQPQRLVVQHMDARHLRYPDGFFDGIFSASSIEHVGDEADVAHTLQEVARVLKPGGIATLSTEFAVAQSGAGGWPGVMVFNQAMLERVIPPSLRPVDEWSFALSEETINSRMTLEQAIAQPERRPHIVLSHRGFTFTSVCLALRKGE